MLSSIVEVFVVVSGGELGRVVLRPVDSDAFHISLRFLGVDRVELLAELLELVEVV